MQVMTQGAPVRAGEVKVGECFTFEIGNNIAIGILIAYPESVHASILVLNRASGQPPSLLDPKVAPPTVVFKQPFHVVTSLFPVCLRTTLGGSTPGDLYVTPDDQFIGFVDHQGDRSLVSLKTGHIFPRPLNCPIAIFDNWHVAIAGSDDSQIIFDFKPAPASQAA